MRRWLLTGGALVFAATAALAQDAAVAPQHLDQLSLTEATPCNGSSEAVIIALPEEAAALRTDAQATRTGPRIRHGADEPRTHLSRLRIGALTFTDQTLDVEQGRMHQFRGRYGAAPVVLVSMFGYEEASYFLGDPASGQQTSAPDIPRLGPDGHTFVSVTRNDGMNQPGVEIIEWRAGAFHSFAFEVEACGLAWVGPDRLIYRTGFDGAAEGRFERRPEGWAMVGPDGQTTLREREAE